MASRQTVYDVVYRTETGVRVRVFNHREDAVHFAAGRRRLGFAAHIEERVLRSRAHVLYPRRRRASSNPSTGAWVAIGLGVTALGIGAYFLAKSMSSSASAAPQLPPNMPPAPAGDKYVVVSIPGQAGQGIVLLSQACASARALAANGNAADAAVWAKVCANNGGTV